MDKQIEVRVFPLHRTDFPFHFVCQYDPHALPRALLFFSTSLQALPRLLKERDQLREELQRLREEVAQARELSRRAREERDEAKGQRERMREERDKAREDKERLESKVAVLVERCDRLGRRVGYGAETCSDGNRVTNNWRLACEKSKLLKWIFFPSVSWSKKETQELQSRAGRSQRQRPPTTGWTHRCMSRSWMSHLSPLPLKATAASPSKERKKCTSPTRPVPAKEPNYL